jgi:hypothetical protein
MGRKSSGRIIGSSAEMWTVVGYTDTADWYPRFIHDFLPTIMPTVLTYQDALKT